MNCVPFLQHGLHDDSLRAFLDCFLEFLVLHVTTFASPSAGHFFPNSSRVLATDDRLDVSCFLISLSPDHICPSGGFSSNEVN